MLQAVINREFADLKEEAIGGDSEENRVGNWLVSECSLLFKTENDWAIRKLGGLTVRRQKGRRKSHDTNAPNLCEPTQSRR